jgi:hypothetical protein
MVIFLVSILVAALALLFAVLVPAIALQILLRLVGPPPARRPPAAPRRNKHAAPVQDSPVRVLRLFRVW